MKVAVCLKEVPSRETRCRVDEMRVWIDESLASFEASECDAYALGEALAIKEKVGGEVTIVTIGMERAEAMIRRGLALGADRGILVLDTERGLQSLQVRHRHPRSYSKTRL